MKVQHHLSSRAIDVHPPGWSLRLNMLVQLVLLVIVQFASDEHFGFMTRYCVRLMYDLHALMDHAKTKLDSDMNWIRVLPPWIAVIVVLSAVNIVYVEVKTGSPVYLAMAVYLFMWDAYTAGRLAMGYRQVAVAIPLDKSTNGSHSATKYPRNRVPLLPRPKTVEEAEEEAESSDEEGQGKGGGRNEAV